MVETLAELILLLLFAGFLLAYVNGGWTGATRFLRLKVIGQ
jgi:hypothetical protein